MIKQSSARSWVAMALLGVSLTVQAGASQEGEGTKPAPVTLFPFEEGARHVLVDDITGDGWQDLLFTSHAGNYVRVYRQTAPRRFEAMADQPIAGFHPDDVITLPGLSKRYLINAEGENSLKVVAMQPDGQFRQISARKSYAPLASTWFNWPGWGVSLVVVPFAGNSIDLLRDFNTETGEAKATWDLKLGMEPKHVRLGDIKGDGIPSLLLTSRRTNEVWAVDYPGPDKDPTPRRIWKFERGKPRHVLPFDIDRDGRLDLLVALATDQRIAVLMNDGQGGFVEGESIPYPGRYGVHVLTASVDQEGTRYLLAGGMGALVLYRERRDAPGRFEQAMLSLPTWPSWVELKDVDGDGWLDAVVASQGRSYSGVIYGPLWKSFAEMMAQGRTVAEPTAAVGKPSEQTPETEVESEGAEPAAGNPSTPPAVRPEEPPAVGKPEPKALETPAQPAPKPASNPN